MKIAFYGSSLLSSYWNGAATYYRGMVRALSERGFKTTFYESDAFDRQKHRDIHAPDWCDVVVYQANPQSLACVAAAARDADIVVKASGCGYADEALFDLLIQNRSPRSLLLFWDVDAPATLAELAAAPDHPLRRQLARTDMVLTYGGGDPVIYGYRSLGVEDCVPIYNAVDPRDHHPVPPQSALEADLSFLGNRLPDREARVEQFFLDVAARLPQKRFLLGGSGWHDKRLTGNVRAIGHVPTADHNAFNCSALAVLNISRESMASTGFSPATRVFEAAGAGACLITDDWAGLDLFLKDGEEVLKARDGKEVAERLLELDPARARAIGRRALERVLAEHTYQARAVAFEALVRDRSAQRALEAAE
jgi:spore maturation protein CgeB